MVKQNTGKAYRCHVRQGLLCHAQDLRMRESLRQRRVTEHFEQGVCMTRFVFQKDHPGGGGVGGGLEAN